MRRNFQIKKLYFVILLLATTTLLLYKVHVTGIVRTNLFWSDGNPNEAGKKPSAALEDISSKYDAEGARFLNSNCILKALLVDGYNPVAVSDIVLHQISIETRPMREGCGMRENRKNSDTTAVGATNQTGNWTTRNNHTSKEVQTESLGENLTSKRKDSKVANFVVPNVVHYVFMGSDLKFTFVNYLSFRSVERFLQPELIFIHGDVIPTSSWWNLTKREVKNIYHVRRSNLERTPNNQPFKFKAHVSDYIRAEVLVRYGGIYLDPDVLVLKSFDSLRLIPFVLGRESWDSVGNGIMIARPGAVFLRLMLEQYRSYKGLDEEWAKQSVHNVHTLSQVYPHLIHIEETSLQRPNWMERALIYDGYYNWTANYAIHLWLRTWPSEKRPTGWQDILTANTTFGDISRLIVFGSHQIILNATTDQSVH